MADVTAEGGSTDARPPPGKVNPSCTRDRRPRAATEGNSGSPGTTTSKAGPAGPRTGQSAQHLPCQPGRRWWEWIGEVPVQQHGVLRRASGLVAGRRTSLLRERHARRVWWGRPVRSASVAPVVGASLRTWGRVNTPENELFPSSPGTAPLYFASDGHPGLGGLDIFASPASDQGSVSR